MATLRPARREASSAAALWDPMVWVAPPSTLLDWHNTRDAYWPSPELGGRCPAALDAGSGIARAWPCATSASTAKSRAFQAMLFEVDPGYFNTGLF